MGRIIVYLILLLLVFVSQGNDQLIYGELVKVIDGDTIDVISHNRYYRIRLAGIDALEIQQTDAEEARLFLEYLLRDRQVYYHIKEYDVYDRAVATVYNSSSNDVSKALLSMGMAVCVNCSRSYKYTEYLARSAKRGIWGLDNFVRPEKYRKLSESASQ